MEGWELEMRSGRYIWRDIDYYFSNTDIRSWMDTVIAHGRRRAILHAIDSVRNKQANLERLKKFTKYEYQEMKRITPNAVHIMDTIALELEKRKNGKNYTTEA